MPDAEHGSSGASYTLRCCPSSRSWWLAVAGAPPQLRKMRSRSLVEEPQRAVILLSRGGLHGSWRGLLSISLTSSSSWDPPNKTQGVSRKRCERWNFRFFGTSSQISSVRFENVTRGASHGMRAANTPPPPLHSPTQPLLALLVSLELFDRKNTNPRIFLLVLVLSDRTPLPPWTSKNLASTWYVGRVARMCGSLRRRGLDSWCPLPRSCCFDRAD